MSTPTQQGQAINNEDHPRCEPNPENAATTKHGLAQDILAVLSEAKAPLTEDEILAVITLRRERTLFEVLEELILQGELGAKREASSKSVATSGDFSFWTLTEEEVAARQKGRDEACDSFVTATDLHNE